ncbi:MAG: hypothetical protein ACREDR_38530 [Blastocatellia bacterium]
MIWLWVLIFLLLAGAVVGTVLGRRYLQAIRLKRMCDNEYNTAVALWNFARIVKGHIDELNRGRAEVIDFTKIKIPHGAGYKISLELSGFGFRVYAIPDRYNRTGKLSLFVDRSLTVRALDRVGEQATADDPEYTGDMSAA